MASKLGVLVLSILVCKIQSQAVEVNTNVHYSQFTSYPSFIQNPTPSAQPVTLTPVPVALPSTPSANLHLNQYFTAPVPTKPAQQCLSAPEAQPAPPVAVNLPPQQYFTAPVPTKPAQQCLSAPVAQPAPPVAVTLPPQQYLTSPVPIEIPAQQYLSAPVAQPPVSVSLPTQPCSPPPTVNIQPTLPTSVQQPVFLPQPLKSPTISYPAPPPTPILPPKLQVSPPPPIAIQELPVSCNVPLIPSLPSVVPSQVVVPPSPIPMISTTVVDNSLANKLANVLQLLLASKTINTNVNPYCNSPLLSDVTPLHEAIGTIGTIYSPLTEVVTAPFYTPSFAVTNILPSIFGSIAEPCGTVTDVVANVGAVSEVISPFGDFYTYSPLTAELLLPTQLVYNLPQMVEPALEQIVFF